jgi:acetolactate synthase-1/2/3 large subunit
VPIVCDARTALEALLPLSRGRGTTAWEEYLVAKKQELALRYEWSHDGMPPQYVVEKLHEVTGGDAIISTEVGQNQMWAAHYYKLDQPRRFVSSGGLGTMGFGLPAAIGAQFANPDRIVVDVAGDGSLQMNIQEMATAMDHALPVKVCLLNNGYLGMVRQWQDLFFQKRYSGVTLSERPDWVKLAEAYGAAGFSTEDPAQVPEIIEQALAINDRPVIMDFRVSKEQNVFPFIPAGQAVENTMLEPPER